MLWRPNIREYALQSDYMTHLVLSELCADQMEFSKHVSELRDRMFRSSTSIAG